MFKLLAVGIGLGAGLQAWRNYPPDGPVAGDMVALVACVGMLAAYLGGRWHGRGHSATAVAVASAEASAEATAAASNRVQVNLFTAAPGGGARPAGVMVPADAGAPWIEGPRSELALDDLDGADLSELVEHQDGETVT